MHVQISVLFLRSPSVVFYYTISLTENLSLTSVNDGPSCPGSMVTYTCTSERQRIDLDRFRLRWRIRLQGSFDFEDPDLRFEDPVMQGEIQQLQINNNAIVATLTEVTERRVVSTLTVSVFRQLDQATVTCRTELSMEATIILSVNGMSKLPCIIILLFMDCFIS